MYKHCIALQTTSVGCGYDPARRREGIHKGKQKTKTDFVMHDVVCVVDLVRTLVLFRHSPSSGPYDGTGAVWSTGRTEKTRDADSQNCHIARKRETETQISTGW